nr:hypothetical protein [Streptomyces catenulae]
MITVVFPIGAFTWPGAAFFFGPGVGGELAEAADALGQARRDVRQVLGFDAVVLVLELAHDLGDVQDVVEGHHVCEQSVELRGLLLLDGVSSVMTPPLPNPIHWKKPLNASTVFVAAVTRRRSGASETALRGGLAPHHRLGDLSGLRLGV